MTFSQRKLQDMVRRGSAWMTARRKAELELVELAKERPETAAREFIVFARMERDRLRQELAGRFGFSVIRERSGFRCRFAAPGRRPKTPEEEATWLDAVVALAGMWLAAAYFPSPDRARMICNAFSDVMREAPAVYAAFAACKEEYAPGAREYASAMLGAWARTHLKSYPRTRAALQGESWADELVSAAHLAFQELGPDSPIKRSTRFRDTLPKQEDGRRQRAPGPPDYINLVSRRLEGRDRGRETQPPELEFATFAEREHFSETV